MIDAVYKKAAGALMVVEGKKGWFISQKNRCVCEVDWEQRTGRIVKYLGTTDNRFAPYYGLAKSGDKLYLLPWLGDTIQVIDWAGTLLREIKLQKLEHSPNMPYLERPRLVYSLRCGRYLFLLGYEYPAILRLDTETEEVTYLTDWVEQVDTQIRENKAWGYFGEGYVAEGDTLYLPLACIPGILELDGKTLKSRVLPIETTAGGIAGLTPLEGDRCCLVCGEGQTNQVLLWNRRKNKVEKTISLPLEPTNPNPLYRAQYLENKLYLPIRSIGCNQFYEYDLKTDTLQKNAALNQLDFYYTADFMEEGILMNVFSEEGKVLHFTDCKELRWHAYQVEANTLESYDIAFEAPKELYQQIFTDTTTVYTRLGETIRENQVPLEALLHSV